MGIQRDDGWGGLLIGSRLELGVTRGGVEFVVYKGQAGDDIPTIVRALWFFFPC
jgi:hypothetical protein